MTFQELYKKYSEADMIARRWGGPWYPIVWIETLPARFARRYTRMAIRKMVADRMPLPDLKIQGNPDYIVSLTSFPKRIGGLPLTLRSLFMQDILPGRIIVWLCSDEWPSTERDFSGLEDFRAKGLEIRFVKENFKSHLKYYHAFREFPDKTIITVDDDLIYQPDTISRLAGLSALNPATICANRTRRITTWGGKFLPYSAWPNQAKTGQGHDLLALGYGGVLYPPGPYRERFTDSDLFMKLAPRADDLWLKAMEIVENIQVLSVGIYVHPVTVPGSQKVTLLKTNMEGTGNDQQWKNLDEYFGLAGKLRRLTGRE